jgi:hypothetical protein
MANTKVRPAKQREFMEALAAPDQTERIMEAKLGQPENNRALELSQRNSEGKNIQVGIQDLDEAVMYYIKNKLKLSVIQNNKLVPVNVIYGTPENWKGVQQDGFYRDKNGKIQAPLIMFSRSSISQNRELGFKIDGNFAQNLQFIEKKYNKRNNYSNFSVLTNRVPEKEYQVVVTPDYVTVTYSCIVWTNFAEQMNKLIESLNFASRSYWGDLERFKFYSSIETFNDSITYEVGEDRLVRTNFDITLNGYLIPDVLNEYLASTKIQYSTSQIVFDLEVSSGDKEQFISKTNRTQAQVNKATNFVGAGANIVNYIGGSGGAASADLAYLNTFISKIANSVTANTATFVGASILQPSPGSSLPPTTVNNFNFYANGLPILANEISSFGPDGFGNLVLIVNTPILGYELTDKIIVAVGKFS